MRDTARIHVGTSGWQYPHWRGPFYPTDLPTSHWLAHYASRLRTVEINRSFYSLPSRAVFEGWRATVPDAFRFAVKGSRYITHMKKLADPIEPVARLLDRISGLGDLLGPVLFQLPPRWRCNHERLARFLEALPPDLRCAFELRDPSWFDERVYELLRARGAAFCIWELAGETSPLLVTTDLVYVRLHGPSRIAYRGCYDRETLVAWAERFLGWASTGHEVYCYFDNDDAGHAAANAVELAEMVHA